MRSETHDSITTPTATATADLPVLDLGALPPDQWPRALVQAIRALPADGELVVQAEDDLADLMSELQEAWPGQLSWAGHEAASGAAEAAARCRVQVRRLPQRASSASSCCGCCGGGNDSAGR